MTVEGHDFRTWPPAAEISWCSKSATIAYTPVEPLRPPEGSTWSIAEIKLTECAPCASCPSCQLVTATLFRFSEINLTPTPNQRHYSAVPPRQEGRTRRHDREAGCDGRGGDAGRASSARTAKACGPDLPTLRPSSRAYEACGRRGQESPVPEESAL